MSTSKLIADGESFGVYQLAGPEDKRQANVDIVFFHGLQLNSNDNEHAWRTTWLSREGQPSVWPQAWLPDDLNSKYGIKARVLSVCNKANARQDTRSAEAIMETLAHGLFQWLVSEQVDVGGSQSGARRCIVLVGHSLGGLVMKQLVVEADHAAHNSLTPAGRDAAERFMKALAGFVFYATPHSGIFWDEFIKQAFVDAVVTPARLAQDWLAAFSLHPHNLNDKFLAIRHKRKLNFPICFAETQATQLASGAYQLVVPVASALLTGANQYEVTADHYDACRPSSRQDVIYEHFFSYVKLVIQPKVTLEDVDDIVRVPTWEQQVATGLQDKGVVCLHGLGGSGKSTLSRVIHNGFCSDIRFNGRVCFLEMGQTPNIAQLQVKLLTSLGLKKPESTFTEAAGRSLIAEALERGPMLLVIDDVWDNAHLEHLLPRAMRKLGEPNSCFSPTKSWLLVTTRNKAVKAAFQGPEHIACIKQPEPDDELQQAMLCKWAHLEADKLARTQLALLPKFIRFCHGLPLHLRVLGALLRDKSEGGWQLLLDKLNAFKLSGVTQSDVERAHDKPVLRASVEDLQPHLLQLFLDFAVFFPTNASRWVDGLPSWLVWCRLVNSRYDAVLEDGTAYGLIRDDMQQLVDRSLLTWSGTGVEPVEVHEALREYALQYIQSEHYTDSLIGYKVAGSGAFTAASIKGYVAKDSSQLLSLACPALRLLRLDRCGYQDLDLSQAPELRMLWVTRCDELTTLKLTGLSQLRALRIMGCSGLQRLPHSLGGCTALTELDLTECSGLEQLDSITNLTSLRRLCLVGSWRSLELPEHLGQLQSLQILDLSYCSQLVSLPPSIGTLTALQGLGLQGCDSLKEVPDVLGQLQSLKAADFTNCSQLASLPPSIGSLTALQVLELQGCDSLEELPDVLGQLQSLQLLDLRRCSQLVSLPPSIGTLTALQVLELQGCDSLKEVPDVLGQLQSLKAADFTNCSQLASLPPSIGNLTALQELLLPICTSLKEVPDVLGQLQSLQILDLSYCSQLASLPPSIGNLTALQELRLAECASLKEVPDVLGQLQSLQILDLSWCSQLASLPPSIGNLTALQELWLQECASLEEVPDVLSQLRSLQLLDLSWCSQLASLPPSIGNLTALQELRLAECASLKEVPDVLGQLQSLQILNLSECSQLASLPPSIGSLTALRQLRLAECASLREVPDVLGQLQSLQILNLSECSQLASLPPSIGSLTALRQLRLAECASLREVPDVLGQLQSLQVLDLSDCSQLTLLPEAISRLQALTELDITGCTSLLPLAVGLRERQGLNIIA